MGCLGNRKTVKTDAIESTQKNERYHESPWMFWKMRRYVVSIMAFFGFFMAWALRVNLSVAIVAMTEVKNISLENGTIISVKDFDWDSKIQGYVLSSFFYGYIITQILGGYLATRFGGKILFGAGIGVTALLTLISPFVAKANLYLFLFVRIIEGIFEGVTYPCIHEIWSKWAPPLERSRLALMAFSGAYVGAVVSMPLCSVLATSFGWESIFYSFGTFGLLWTVLWMTFISDSPEEDSRISVHELKYITESLSRTEIKKNVQIPWRVFATSMPVWAIALANFSENWGAYTLLTQLPKFMKSVLKFDLNAAGFMSSLPYLGNAIMLPLSGQFVDWILVRGFMTTTRARKLFNCTGFVCQAIFLMIPSFWLSSAGTVFCLTLAQTMAAISWAGFSVNHLDIAPKYAGILMGIGNTFGTVPGIFSPIVAGYIVTEETNVDQWRIIFYISSGLYLFGACFYGTFASCDIQPWAREAEKEVQLEPKEEAISYENKTFQFDSI